MKKDDILKKAGPCPSASRDNDLIINALNAANEHPEIKSRLEAEIEFDRTFSEKISAYPVPEGLKDQILSNFEKTKTLQFEDNLPAEKSSGIPFFTQLKIAASIILLLGLSLFILNQKPADISTPGNYQDKLLTEAVDYTKSINGLHKNKDVQELKTYLAANLSPVPEKAPPGLDDLTGIGCRTVSLEGDKVSLICLKGEKIYHLFVSDRSTMKQSIDNIDTPVFHDFGDRSSATWTQDNQLFMLIVQGNKDDLQKILAAKKNITT